MTQTNTYLNQGPLYLQRKLTNSSLITTLAASLSLGEPLGGEVCGRE